MLTKEGKLKLGSLNRNQYYKFRKTFKKCNSPGQPNRVPTHNACRPQLQPKSPRLLL
jgi:hypothetical protein